MPEPDPRHPPAALETTAVVERGTFRLDATFRVEPGEMLAVLGPNGSGKTTLLRALAGLIGLTHGRIAVGPDVWDDTEAGILLAAHERAVGLMFQDYRLFPHLSVVDNVAFPARARGAHSSNARAEARDWLERVGLADKAEQRPRQLSGGQAQRVALARALASRPRMLLLDEPLAALDSLTRMEIRAELGRHLTAFDGPCLMVTHDPLEALMMADRIMVLEHGRVIQQGAPTEVARRPATEYVASLMGLNLYAGRPRGPGTHLIDLDTGGTLFAAGSDLGEAATATATVAADLPARMLVAVSPTAIAVHLHRPEIGSPRNQWTGTVTGMELLTDRVRLSVEGHPNALADITPAAVAQLQLTVGQQVWLTAKATEVLAYPDPKPDPRPNP